MAIDLIQTTVGTCVVCANRAPPGASLFRLGGVVLGIGLLGGMAAAYLRVHPYVPGGAMLLGVAIGLPLIIIGGRRTVRGAPGFARVALQVTTGSVKAGEPVRARVQVIPDHGLTLRSATCELVALELNEGAEPNTLQTLEQPLDLGAHVSTLIARELELTVPANWPATMVTPDEPSLPKRRISTRLRVSLDFDAHPLVTVEQPVLIAAP